MLLHLEYILLRIPLYKTFGKLIILKSDIYALFFIKGLNLLYFPINSIKKILKQKLNLILSLLEKQYITFPLNSLKITLVIAVFNKLPSL